MTGRRRAAGPVAAGLLALLATGAGPRPPSAADAPVMLTWQPAGAAEGFRLAVPRSDLAGFLAERAATLEAERAALQRRAAEALAQDLAMLEVALLRGLPDFADWAYGWVESYVTAYVVLGEVLSGQLAPGPEGRPRPWRAYRTALDGVVAERFAALMVAPAGLQDWQAGAQARLEAVLREGWAASLSAEQTAWDAFLGRRAKVAGRGVAEPGCTVAAPTALLPVPSPGVPDENLRMTLRAVRPFAGRGGLLALRLGLGAGAAEITGLVGVVLQPSLTGIASIASGFLTLWTGDWLLSRIDGAVNRAGFEAAAVGAVRGIRAEVEAGAGAALAASLEAAFAARRGCAGEVTPA
jgi:hypothetical protein